MGCKALPHPGPLLEWDLITMWKTEFEVEFKNPSQAQQAGWEIKVHKLWAVTATAPTHGPYNREVRGVLQLL